MMLSWYGVFSRQGMTFLLKVIWGWHLRPKGKTSTTIFCLLQAFVLFLVQALQKITFFFSKFANNNIFGKSSALTLMFFCCNQEENKKEVIENQVKMKIDLENLIVDVKQLNKDMKRMNQKDKEIVKQNRSIEKQHKDLFKFLEQNQGMNQQNEQKGGYSYGD